MMFQQFLNVGYGYRRNLSGYSRIKTNHQKIKLISYVLYGEHMLKFCVVSVLITRLQGEIP